MGNEKKEPTIFGMTHSAIIDTANELSNQKDTNHPQTSGSNKYFLDTLKKGKELLFKQPGYCRALRILDC
jgi:hypothetical protein